jgi:hypothetical protein
VFHAAGLLPVQKNSPGLATARLACHSRIGARQRRGRPIGTLSVGHTFTLEAAVVNLSPFLSCPEEAESVILAMPSELPRRSIRVALGAEVGIRRANEKYRMAQLRNLSSHGCSVELVTKVNLNETLWVKLPSVAALQGLVCWIKDYTCGIEFDTPLHPAVSDMLTARLRG